MKKINIKFGDKMFVIDEKTTLEDFLKQSKGRYQKFSYFGKRRLDLKR